jgi:hypothetical protein
MSRIGGEFFSSPAAIPSTHAEAIGQTWPTPIIPTARRRRSANTPQAGETFHKISGGRNAFGGFGHRGGDLADLGDVLRGEDPAQVHDRRFLGIGRKAPPGAHLQSFDRSSPERLIRQCPDDQLADSAAQARGQGARATVVRMGEMEWFQAYDEVCFPDWFPWGFFEVHQPV